MATEPTPTTGIAHLTVVPENFEPTDDRWAGVDGEDGRPES